MKRLTLLVALNAAMLLPAGADIPVIDGANLEVARRTAERTSRLLETNRHIRRTVEQTLEAVTGDRAGVAGPLGGLAIGDGFSVSALPGLEDLFTGGQPDLHHLDPELARAVRGFINGLQLVSSLSGRTDRSLASDRSYQHLVESVLGVAALVDGSRQALQTRRGAFEAAGATIGAAEDIKGSIDQNTQLQVQTGLTLNEMIGVMNGAVQSLLAENQRRLTDMSNTRKALRYGD